MRTAGTSSSSEPARPQAPSPEAGPSSHLSRTAWRTLGTACIAVGVINAFLPLLPTTVFLLVGVWAYGKSDPVLREQMMQHPRFGHALRLWVEKRQISRRGKWAASTGIVLSGALSALALGPRPVTYALLTGLSLLVAYLVTRQEP